MVFKMACKSVSAYIHIIIPLPRLVQISIPMNVKSQNISCRARAATTMKSIECHRINRALVFIFIQSVCPMMVIVDGVICDRNYSYVQQNILKSSRLPTFRINQTYKSIMFQAKNYDGMRLLISTLWHPVLSSTSSVALFHHSPWNKTQKWFHLHQHLHQQKFYWAKRIHASISLRAIYLSGEYKVYSSSCIWNLFRNCCHSSLL